jgi:FG-GAP-like repeat
VPPAGFLASQHTVSAAGDIDLDGQADIVWRNTTNGQVSYFRMGGAIVLGSGVIQAVLSQTWTAMGGGDFNGDGIMDVGYRKPATGEVLLRLMKQDFTTLESAQYQLSTGWSHVGFPDVNGDGRADVLWRKPSNGKLMRWKMNGLTVMSTTSVGTGPTGTAKVYAEK